MVVSTRRKATEAGSLMQVIQDSLCVTSILEFLDVEDSLHFSMCSKTTYVLFKDDLTLNFMQQFFKTYSKSWWSWFDRLEDQVYADDVPFAKLRRGGLDTEFARLYAKTEQHMLHSIAHWSGGWESFVQARKFGARPILAEGETASNPPAGIQRAGHNNRIHNRCKPVVIFDIHCDSEYKWSALHPLCIDDMRTLEGVSRDDENYGIFYPYSSRCLGDPTDCATAYPWNHGRRPSKYLLSTDISDDRSYQFSASIISPNFAETRIISFEFSPSDICNNKPSRIEWQGNSGSLNAWVRRDPSFQRHPQLHRSNRILFYGTNENFGRQEDGDVDDKNPRLDICFYRDKRQNPERLHFVLVGLWMPTTSFYHMLVHPAAAHTTNQTGAPKKRRI